MEQNNYSSSYHNKILIIDDERELCGLLQVYLAKEGFHSVYTAHTGKDGIQRCREVQPDIIILDIMLPDIDGFEVCRKLREFTYEPVLFLSAKEEETDKILGLGIGGDDYITKPFSLKEVTFRIRAQLRRKQYMERDFLSQIMKFDNIAINGQAKEVTKDGQPVDLTAKEFQILTLLARHPNHILSKKKLYENIWGEEYMGDDNTIMVHIRHLREKLEKDPGNPALILTVKGLGYKLSVKTDRSVG
ncbi:MAG: response regulator transcription factor [Ruminiclostridium sp.]|nr:response regulator transcription factor [Ruminiclostridium sp.]